MTLRLPLFAALLAGCTSADTADTKDTTGGVDSDSGGATDSDSGGDTSSSSTQTAAFVQAGSFTTADGTLTAADLGLSWVNQAGWPAQVVCHVAGDTTVGSTSDCPTCTWSYTVTVSEGETTGDRCDLPATVDPATFFSLETGLGFADVDVVPVYGDGGIYTDTEVGDVVWMHFYDDSYAQWLPIAYNTDELAPVTVADGVTTFTSRFALSYYTYTYASD